MDQRSAENNGFQTSESTLSSNRDQEYVGGFYLTKSELESVRHFRPMRLISNWTFWHDKRGFLVSKINQNEAQIVVAGTFYHLDEIDQDDAVERLLRSYEQSIESFEYELDLLVGRYVVVVSTKNQVVVYHDALGTRSVYYSTTSKDVASHYNLLAETLAVEQDRTWDEARMAMDLTLSPQIRQLLPNFRLDCDIQTPTRFFPVSENEFTHWTHEEKLVEITRLWKRSINDLLTLNKSVVFSITGGLDSRLSVAMAHDHWKELNLYTYGSKQPKNTHYSKVMNRDFKIPQSLIEIIQPKDYKFLHLAENKRLPTQLSDLIQTNSITRHGPGLVQRYRTEFSGDDWIHVRSTGVEVMRNYFGADESLRSIIRMCELDGATNFSDRIKTLGYDSPQHGYNRKDLIYWELRMGKWHSEVLNENDAAFETILPHNSRRLIKLFLAYSVPDRRSAFAIKELINRNAPLLNFYGVNDTRNLYEIVRDANDGNINLGSSPGKAPSTKELVLQTAKIVRVRGVQSVKRRLGNAASVIRHLVK